MALWLCAVITFFFLFIGFTVKPVSSTADSYSDHCSLTVPASIPNSESLSYQFGPFGEYQSPGFYYSNHGIRIVNANTTRHTNSFSIYTSSVHKTDEQGVFMIEASFELQSSFQVRSGSSKNSIPTTQRPVVADYENPFDLKLHGFWKQSSGKLCMVGTGSAYFQKGNLLTPVAVLKLHNIKNSSSITSLITGTLESLSPSNDKNYFEPISILMLPQLNYKWSFVSGDSVDNFSGESDVEKNLPLYSVLQGQGGDFCSKFSSLKNVFNLDYTIGCNSRKSCLPFGGVVEKLPGSVYLDTINCIDVQKRVRILLKFQDHSNFRFYQPFNPNTTLVGEGIWDDQKNQLCVFLCQFLEIKDSWSNAHVGDCTARLNMRFPAIWSIKKTSSIMGEIWSNKTVNDSGYFTHIAFQSTQNNVEAVHGLKYEYTEMDRVKKLCLGKKVLNKRQRYPNPYSSDMKFDMLVKNSEGKKTGWGYSIPLAVGKQFYKQYASALSINHHPEFSSTRPTKWKPQGHANVSYKIDISLRPVQKSTDEIYVSALQNEKMEITAEGIYDADTGGLCMVGCRKFASIEQENVLWDCEILLNFQLAPVKEFRNGGYVRGRIESTRKTSDPLYFDHLEVSSVAYNTEQAKDSIWTMDLEIVMVLVTKTLACLFIRYQLYHMKRKPETLPYVSLIMLVILTLGQMIPLVLNYEALFLQKHDPETVLSQTGGWLEVNEVILRIISMVAFLLQFRILQLAFSSRSNEGNQKGIWFSEKMSLLVTISLYASGAFIVMFIDSGKNHKREVVYLPTRPVDHWQRSSWDDLKSYAGLISDGFLLPQILLNMFSNSRKDALTREFYIGTSFARLLPHVYDLYSDHSYVQYKGTYIYVNPTEDFFSTAWDVIIPLGVLLFAVIIYMQQKFGGRCILPQRFRGLECYENFPMASES